MEGWVDVCVLVTPLAVGVGEYCFSPLVSLSWLCWEGKYSDQLYVGGMNVCFVSPVIKADGQNALRTGEGPGVLYCSNLTLFLHIGGFKCDGTFCSIYATHFNIMQHTD